MATTPAQFRPTLQVWYRLRPPFQPTISDVTHATVLVHDAEKGSNENDPKRTN